MKARAAYCGQGKNSHGKREGKLCHARERQATHPPLADRRLAAMLDTIPIVKAPLMSEVTRILSAIEQGDPHAAQQLLPLVYDELRKLAAAKLAQEKPGQTLQATALVHEAYLRLVTPPASP